MNAVSNQPRADSYRLRTSRYDRASSLLLSLLILIGLVVLVLLITWLTNQIFVSQTAVPVELADFDGGDGPVGGGHPLEAPTPEEIQELEIEEPVLSETLNVISEVVKVKTPQLDDPALKRTGGSGLGDGRGVGTGHGDGHGGVVRRWEVHFLEGGTLEAYAKQLDFFGIELAVLRPDGKVVYISNLAKRKPDVRVASAEGEKRYYLTWRSGDLQQADRELLARAGVDAGNGIILKFLPPAVEAQLAALEKAYAGSKAAKLRKTRFGIQSAGQGYSFFVLEQTYNR